MLKNKFNSHLEFFDSFSTALANMMIFSTKQQKEEIRDSLMKVLIEAQLSKDSSEDKELKEHLNYLMYKLKLNNKYQ